MFIFLFVCFFILFPSLSSGTRSAQAHGSLRPDLGMTNRSQNCGAKTGERDGLILAIPENSHLTEKKTKTLSPPPPRTKRAPVNSPPLQGADCLGPLGGEKRDAAGIPNFESWGMWWAGQLRGQREGAWRRVTSVQLCQHLALKVTHHWTKGNRPLSPPHPRVQLQYVCMCWQIRLLCISSRWPNPHRG